MTKRSEWSIVQPPKIASNSSKHLEGAFSFLRTAPHPCLTQNYTDFVATVKCKNDTLATTSLRRPNDEMVD